MVILFNNFLESINTFLLTLDGWAYGLIDTLYKVFLVLSRLTLFGEDDIAPFIRRIYMIIGVVMLFILSYNLLMNIVNPEGKGKDTAGKTIFNIVKAVILLALVPTIFDFAYQLQTAILSHNTIGKIIMGTGSQYTGSTKTPEEVLNDGGTNMALGVIQAFIVPTGDKTAAESHIEGAGYTLQDVWTRIERDNSFSYLSSIAPATAVDENKRELEYHFLLSTIAALGVIYILISYCLSLGVRVFKLAFYELIAPVPIMASIVPNKKDMLGKWISATLSTFFEVFIRIAVLYFAVYILDFLGSILNDSANGVPGLLSNLGVTGIMKPTIYAIIIMGFLAFIKQAPNLISDITGISSENTKFGIREQLKNGGLFTAGALAGGLATSTARRFVGSIQRGHQRFQKNKKDVQDTSLSKGKRVWAGFKAAGSILGTMGGMTIGAATSGIRGGIGSYNKDAGSFKDVREAAHKGAASEDERLLKKYKYRASHGGFVKSIGGHFADAGRSIGDWSGISSVDAYVQENELLQKIADAKSKVKDGALKLADKEASKADSSFKVAGSIEIDGTSLDFSAENLRKLQLEMEQAKASGAANYANLANNYAKFRAAFGDAIQNVAFKSEKEWAAVDEKIRAKVAAINIDAEAFRTLLTRNIGNETVAAAGYTVTNVKQSFDVTVGPTSAIGDKIDIKMAENNNKINKFNEKRSDSGDKK